MYRRTESVPACTDPLTAQLASFSWVQSANEQSDRGARNLGKARLELGRAQVPEPELAHARGVHDEAGAGERQELGRASWCGGPCRSPPRSSPRGGGSPGWIAFRSADFPDARRTAEQGRAASDPAREAADAARGARGRQQELVPRIRVVADPGVDARGALIHLVEADHRLDPGVVACHQEAVEQARVRLRRGRRHHDDRLVHVGGDHARPPLARRPAGQRGRGAPRPRPRPDRETCRRAPTWSPTTRRRSSIPSAQRSVRRNGNDQRVLPHLHPARGGRTPRSRRRWRAPSRRRV